MTDKVCVSGVPKPREVATQSGSTIPRGLSPDSGLNYDPAGPQLAYGKMAPMLNEIRDVEITFTRAYHRSDGLTEASFSGNQRWTRHRWSLLEQRWNLEVLVKYDDAASMVHLYAYRTIGAIFDDAVFPSCQVWAWPTGWFFPQIVYMDTLPANVITRGTPIMTN